MKLTRRQALATASTVPLVSVLSSPAAKALEKTLDGQSSSSLMVGCGLSDVTGAAAECGMQGYAQMDQKTSGIHMRTRARAFIIANQTKRVVLVTAEISALYQSVHQGVLARLKNRFGSLYTEQNVVLNATHSHAACGGDSHYAAYSISALGHEKQTYDAVVAGICEAIEKAHAKLAPGSLSLGRSTLLDASANRSISAFNLNPAHEKAHFPGGVDPNVTSVKFQQSGKDVGAIVWFAVHNTSLTNKNTLISGDNKGRATYMLEKSAGGGRYLEADSGFIGAFAQTNAGDLSANLALHPGKGPTDNEFENAKIIGDRQFTAGQKALNSSVAMASDIIDSRMCYVDFANVSVDGRFTHNGLPGKTAAAAIGMETLEGTVSDGPGMDMNKFTTFLADFLGEISGEISEEMEVIHAPKDISMPFGTIKPHPWAPSVLPLQIVRVGDLYLLAVPAEFTVVAGYRLRKTVADELGVSIDNVLVQGYANAYSQYVTTFEEYSAQGYEGASTLFGPHTLGAYRQEFTKLAAALKSGESVPLGPTPPDLTGKTFSFQTGVMFDDKPLFTNFGDTLVQPYNTTRGNGVRAVFRTGHPKNHLRRNHTFALVQRLVNGNWQNYAHDGDWAVIYRWKRIAAAESEAEITWDTTDAPTGTYRIVHYGNWKNGWDGAISDFTGVSKSFSVN